MADRIISVTLQTNAPNYTQAMKQAAAATKQAGTEIGGVEQRTKSSSSSMSTFKDIAKTAAGTLIGFGGAQIVLGAVSGAVSTLKDSILGFDDEITQSLAIMGNVSAGTRKEMEDAARKTAVDYNASLKDTAASYYYLASAGYDAQTSIKILPQVTAFAKAGMMDLEAATSYAADAQAALGLKTDDAQQNMVNLARITDVLTQANNKANGSVEDFSKALTTKAAAAARLAGIPLEEVVGTLEQFASVGVKGKRAGEAFTIVLRDLQDKSMENKDAFEQLGIAVYNADGSMRHMYDIIADVENALKGQNVEQQNVTLGMLGFTAESMAYFKNLVGGSAAIRDFTQANYEAGGAVQEVAQKQMQSMVEKIAHLKAVAIDLGITGFGYLATSVEWLGDQFGPAFGDIVSLLGKVEQRVEPVAKGFAMMGGAAVVGGVEGLAKALGFVADKADESEAVVTLLSIAVTALALKGMVAAASATYAWASSLAGGWIAKAALEIDIFAESIIASTGVTQGAAAAQIEEFGAINATTIALRTQAESAGVAATASQVAGTVGASAWSGIAAAASSPLVVIAAVGAAVYGAVHAFDAGREAAQKFVDALPKPKDSWDFGTMDSNLASIEARQHELTAQINGQKNGILDIGSATADWLVPLHDVKGSLVDNHGEMERLNEEWYELSGNAQRYKVAIGDVAGALHISGDEAEAWLKKLNIDPTTMSWKEYVDKVRQAKAANESATPGSEALAAAQTQVGDETASATDKMKAYKDAVDAIIGVVISAFDADTKWAQSTRDLAASITENGHTLDAYTDKGQKNREALSGAAQAALDHAQAVYAESGSVDEANKTLGDHVLQLYGVLIQTGLNDQQAQDYLRTLGLTPENLATLIHLDGVPVAVAGAQAVKDKLDSIPHTKYVLFEVDTAAARAALSEINQIIANAAGSIYALNSAAGMAVRNPGKTFVPSANGNIITTAYANGGFDGPHVAQIATRGPRLWAEPETGGEAYIPLAGSKRPRSASILNQVATRFGYSLTPMAQGGLLNVTPLRGSGGLVISAPIMVDVRTQSNVDRAQLAAAVRGGVADALAGFTAEIRTERRARRSTS